MAVSISTPMSDSIVLIAEIASAPPFTAAFAIGTMSVTFGVSFTITGKSVPFFAARVTISTRWGSCPMNAPICFSGEPCGHETFSSIASAFVWDIVSAKRVHPSGSGSLIMLATRTKSSGDSSLIFGIHSSIHVFRGSRDISSILFIPIGFPFLRRTPSRVLGSTVGSSVTVLITAPPHPSFAARMI